MCKNVDGLNGKLGKAVDWAVTVARIVTPMILSVMAWAWWNHEQRIDENKLKLATITANRFTAADGLEVWREISAVRAELDGKADIQGAEPVWREIDNIKAELNRLRD